VHTGISTTKVLEIHDSIKFKLSKMERQLISLAVSEKRPIFQLKLFSKFVFVAGSGFDEKGRFFVAPPSPHPIAASSLQPRQVRYVVGQTKRQRKVSQTVVASI
jgi:hypothetical protein